MNTILFRTTMENGHGDKKQSTDEIKYSKDDILTFSAEVKVTKQKLKLYLRTPLARSIPYELNDLIEDYLMDPIQDQIEYAEIYFVLGKVRNMFLVDLCAINYSGVTRDDKPFLLLYSCIKSYPQQIVLILINEIITIMTEYNLVSHELIGDTLPIISALYYRGYHRYSGQLINMLSNTVHNLSEVFVIYHQTVAMSSDNNQKAFLGAVQFYQKEMGC